jgi:transcriptional regulator
LGRGGPRGVEKIWWLSANDFKRSILSLRYRLCWFYFFSGKAMLSDSIYLPKPFDDKNPEHAKTLMREHPLALVVSTSDTGAPLVSHLPLKCEVLDERGEQWVLWGHFARINPQVQALQSKPQALAIFTGPNAYMSPSVYPDLVRVPTWNYLTLHVQGALEFLDEPQTKDQLLKQLIADHERSYAAQWRGLSEDYQQKMLSAIIGFRMRISHRQLKLKLNQHRPEAHQAMFEQYSQGNESMQSLARWMSRLGMVDGP